MRTKNAGLVCRISGSVVSDSWIFAQRNTNSGDLPAQVQTYFLQTLYEIPTFCANSCIWSRTRSLQAGWNNTGKLHGSRNVIKCDSRGKKSIERVSNPASCSCACLEESMRRRICGWRRAIQTKYDFRYLRRSKSAIRQSTICGSGESRYMASISGFLPLFSSILSISTLVLDSNGLSSNKYYILAMFSLRMSSSLMTLSIIFLAPSSTTKTFHCSANQQGQALTLEDQHLLELFA
jgi:hypothetical protein